MLINDIKLGLKQTSLSHCKKKLPSLLLDFGVTTDDDCKQQVPSVAMTTPTV